VEQHGAKRSEVQGRASEKPSKADVCVKSIVTQPNRLKQRSPSASRDASSRAAQSRAAAVQAGRLVAEQLKAAKPLCKQGGW